jgi:hypothetical protein
MAFGAVFAAILAVVAAADVDREIPEDDPAEVVDSADPGVPAAAQPLAVAQASPAPQPALPSGAVAAATTPGASAAPIAAALPVPAPTPAGTALADSAPILLDRADRANGWALERILEPSGDIVEHEVNRAGTVQSCRTVGSLFTLRLLEQKAAAGGQVVQVVRDASGALLRFAVGPDGEPRAVALLAPPPR